MKGCFFIVRNKRAAEGIESNKTKYGKGKDYDLRERNSGLCHGAGKGNRRNDNSTGGKGGHLTRDVPPPAEAVAPAEEVLELTFTVRGTRDKLRKLKTFLIEGGYDYE